MIFLQALLLTFALSADCLASGFIYGINKIKIPFISGLIINLICSAALAISLFLGGAIGKFVPKTVTVIICVSILIVMGIIKILGCFLNKNELYKNPERADKDKNKILSKKEAILVAIIFSVDGLAAGVGAGLVNETWINYLTIVGFSLVIGCIFLFLGSYVGGKFVNKIKINLDWLSGLILIGIAIMKFFS